MWSEQSPMQLPQVPKGSHPHTYHRYHRSFTQASTVPQVPQGRYPSKYHRAVTHTGTTGTLWQSPKQVPQVPQDRYPRNYTKASTQATTRAGTRASYCRYPMHGTQATVSTNGRYTKQIPNQVPQIPLGTHPSKYPNAGTQASTTVTLGR